MATLPTIPASMATLNIGDYLRGEPIESADLVALQEAANFVVANRIKCHLNKSWMEWPAGGAIGGTVFNGAVAGYVTGVGVLTTSARCIWLNWSSLAYDGYVRLRIADNIALTGYREYAHIHQQASGNPSYRITEIAVEPETTYYYAIEAEDGVANIELWAVSLYDREMRAVDLSRYVPHYSSITAAIADGRVAGDAIWLDTQSDSVLMYCRPGSDFEYPGRTDTPAALWVPWRYRDAYVSHVVNAAVTAASQPNTSWGWSFVPGTGGTETPAGVITTYVDPDATSYAYIEDATGGFGGHSGDLLAFMDVRCSAAVGGTNTVRLEIRDGTTLYDVSVSSGGVAGDVKLNVGQTPTAYGNGAGTHVKLLVEFTATANTVNVWMYDSMQLIGTANLADFAGAGGLNRVRIGCTIAADTATWHLQGFPAVAVMEAR